MSRHALVMYDALTKPFTFDLHRFGIGCALRGSAYSKAWRGRRNSLVRAGTLTQFCFHRCQDEFQSEWVKVRWENERSSRWLLIIAGKIWITTHPGKFLNGQGIHLDLW